MAPPQRPVSSESVTLPGDRFLFLHRRRFEVAGPFLAARGPLLLFVPGFRASRGTHCLYSRSDRAASFNFPVEPEASRGSVGGSSGHYSRWSAGHGGLHSAGAEFRVALLRSDLRHLAPVSKRASCIALARSRSVLGVD